VRVRQTQPVGGGCISRAARLDLEDGDRAFLKWTPDGVAAPGFAAEAASLSALGRTGVLRVPRVRASGARWLLLEWLEPGSPVQGTWEALGRGLAGVHAVRGPAFGWPADNWIGSLPQHNTQHAEWPPFWRDQRLAPQWRSARAAGFFGPDDDRAFERLCSVLENALRPGDADGPSLLHGDLWSGNVHVLEDGRPALIDPACSWGHREVDLAMAGLFGGFGDAFFDAYCETWPLRAGYNEQRRLIYQLYYLLVHVNLFGARYVQGVRTVVRTACG